MPSASPRARPKTPAGDIDLVFIDAIPKEFECPICQQVLRYPVSFDQCEHHCCSTCLPDLIKSGSRCPVDGKSIDRDKAFVDKPLQKRIQALRVKCSFMENGCTWDAHLRDLPVHIQECEYAVIKCQRMCGDTYERRFHEKHQNEECGKRLMQCDYCSKEVRFEQLEEHYRACTHYPLVCPNSCSKQTYPREQLRKHMETCPKAGSVCPFNEFGCKHKGERTTLQKHISAEPTRHLSLLCDGVIDLKRILMQLQLMIERMSNRVDTLGVRCDALEKLYGAQLLWKIDNYQQKFNEAKSGAKTTIFSPPFLTGRHGYKMALSICLFGDGKARGKYISLYAGILRGDYDALLTWPFAHRVTFTLLDQCQDPAARKNITYTVKPNVIMENRAFLGRPTAERNASFGAQKFCEMSMLDKLDYIRDDIMFIKVQVDMDEMPAL